MLLRWQTICQVRESRNRFFTDKTGSKGVAQAQHIMGIGIAMSIYMHIILLLNPLRI